jgi:AraC-like DNA-binding protein
MLAGEGRFLIDDIEYIINEKDLLVISPFRPHAFFEENVNSRMVVLQFNDDLIADAGEEVKDLRITDPLITRSKNKVTYIKLDKLVRELMIENGEKAAAFEFASRILVERIFLTIIREMKWEKAGDESKKIRKKRLHETIRYIQENYYRPISLARAAREANFSEYYFARYFKETIGSTFKEYLENIRIEKAKRFLRNTEASVTEIAISNGFNSINSFERAFKKKTGETPLAYRRKQRSTGNGIH